MDGSDYQTQCSRLRILISHHPGSEADIQELDSSIETQMEQRVRGPVFRLIKDVTLNGDEMDGDMGAKVWQHDDYIGKWALPKKNNR